MSGRQNVDKQLSFVSLNVHGGLNNKIDNDVFVQSIIKYDIILLSETWTTSESQVDIHGYKRISKLRRLKKHSRRSSGGLEFFIREHMFKGISIAPWESDEDSLTIKFDKTFFGWDNDLYLFFIYIKPGNSSRQDIADGGDGIDMLYDQLSNIDDDSMVVIIGDTNCRIGTKNEVYFKEPSATDELLLPLSMFKQSFTEDDFTNNDMSVERANEDDHVNDIGLKLIQMCYSLDLAVLNGRAFADKGKGVKTFCGPQGESAVDFCICNKPTIGNIIDFSVSDISEFSDHKYVSFKLKLSNSMNNDDNVNETGTCTYFPKWKEKNKEKFIKNLNKPEVRERVETITELLNNNTNENYLNEALTILTEAYTEAGDEHRVKVGGRVFFKKGTTWYDEDCVKQRELFFEYRDRYNRLNTDENRKLMCRERGKYRKMCRSKKAVSNRHEAERLVNLSKNDSKTFWKEIKSGKKKDENGACNFFEHFKLLAQKDVNIKESAKEEIERCNIANETNPTTVDALDREITLDELNASIKELKKDKASGCDHILNEFLVNSSLLIKYLILSIFNSILTLECFPKQWCVGSITPVFKSGEKNNPTNYRGITLLSCLGKLFTKILNKRMNSWAEEENLLSESQFGFRQGRGTTDCLFILHGMLELILGKGGKLYAAFVDYEKCYDYLDRASIFAKLIKNGLSTKCIRIFRSMYSQMKLEVRGNNERFDSTLGLLQGEITSPIFFSFFVNDLENGMLNEDEDGIPIFNLFIRLLMYADDMVIVNKTIEGLQVGLNNLHSYCTKWGITVNTRKTKIVVFRKGGRISKACSWHYGETPLEVVSIFKYLGLFISAGGSFSHHVKETVNSAKRALFGLTKIFAKKTEMVPRMKIDLFKSMITPILLYGSEVWGFCRADPIERFYLSFLKSILCVKKSTPNCFVYGELGVYPLYIERQIRIFKFWVKIIKSKDNSFIKQMYYELVACSIIYPNSKTWVTLLKEMLCKYGLGYYWANQFLINPAIFVNVFKQRVHDVYLQEWRAEVDETSNLRLYKHVKLDFGFESYLCMYNSSLRVSITRLRLSSHLFLIERGRWGRNRLEYKDRVCTLCKTIEDEFHCLIECPRYIKERKGCLPEILRKRPSMYEFIKYLKCENENYFDKMGLLCFKIMKKHRETEILIEV